jgi:hypothetical protein
MAWFWFGFERPNRKPATTRVAAENVTVQAGIFRQHFCLGQPILPGSTSETAHLFVSVAKIT